MDKKGRILIVDDKKINRFILAGMFDEDYDIIEVADGKEAITVIEEEKGALSVILLDIIMPKVDGFAVLRYMEEHHLFDLVPVVLVTMNGSKDNIRRAYEYGIADFIQKPFDDEIVKRRVKNIIELYQKRKDVTDITE